LCNPLLLAVGVAATTAAKVAGDAKAAAAQARALNAQSAAQATQIAEAATAERLDTTVEGFRRSGVARVAGAGRGLNDASGSLDMALKAIQMDTDFDTARIEKQASMQQDGRLNDTRSRLSTIQQPTLLSAGLQVAGAGASAYVGAGGKV
jgi:hypothetical protein